MSVCVQGDVRVVVCTAAALSASANQAYALASLLPVLLSLCASVFAVESVSQCVVHAGSWQQCPPPPWPVGTVAQHLHASGSGVLLCPVCTVQVPAVCMGCVFVLHAQEVFVPDASRFVGLSVWPG